MRKGIFAAVLLLAGCVAPKPAEQPPAVSPITGGEISQTTLPTAGAPVTASTASPGAKSAPKAPPPPPTSAATQAAPPAKPAGPTTETAAEVVPLVMISPEEIACVKDRGSWGAVGRSGAHTCVYSTRDAGKSCGQESDCEGVCLARSKTCAPVRPLFGCNDILQDDGVMATLCID